MGVVGIRRGTPALRPTVGLYFQSHRLYNRIMTKRLVLPALLAALAVLASCGGGSSSGGTVPADTDVTITAVDGIAWSAKDYTATSTDGKVKIAGENASSLPHNLHVIDADGVENPTFIDLPTKGTIEAKEFSLTPGTYTVLCKIPGHGNMKATLTVS